MEKSRLSARIDWNRMLGFEQIADARDSIRETASRMPGPKVGQKVGEKVGVKLGGKVGSKVGNKLGVKLGTKTGIKS